MKRHNNYMCDHRKQDAVISIPMSLCIILIISIVIVSLYAIGSSIVVTFYQEEQIRQSISNVVEEVSIMTAFSSQGSQITMSLSFPPVVDSVVFGCDSVQRMKNISFQSRSCITVLYKSGKQKIMHCSIPFCDNKQDPLLFHSGTYHVLFSTGFINGEVVVIGSIV